MSPPGKQPQEPVTHTSSTDALVPAPAVEKRHSRRFFLTLAILALLFLALGIRALLTSRPDLPSAPAAQGGIVVLTSIKGMAADASMTIDTRSGNYGDVTTFHLSLNLQAPTRAVRRRLLAQTTDGVVFERPFRYAVLFTGSARLADSVTAERNTSDKGPRLTCDCQGDPSWQVQLNQDAAQITHKRFHRASGIPTMSTLPTLGNEFHWDATPLVMTSSEPQPTGHSGPIQFSPAVPDAEVGKAYGYDANGAQLLEGTTMTGHRHISGMLAKDPFARARGREQGSLVTVADRFPRHVVLAADAADGTYLERAAPAEARFRLKAVPAPLYATRVRSNRLRVAKRPFDRLDFASPEASATDASVVWRRGARGAPFYWQLSSDSEITAASERATGAGLIAGVSLGLAASLLVVLVETLVSEWRTSVTLRRSRRLLAALLAVAATFALLLSIGDTQYTRVARIAGELALLLWLYLGWTRRRAGRWRLTSIAKSVVTVAAASWAALLVVYEVTWALDWSSTWIVALLLLGPSATAFTATRRLRHLTAHDPAWPALWLGAGTAAVLTSLAWLYPSPSGFLGVVAILAFEIGRQWVLGSRRDSRRRARAARAERPGSRPRTLRIPLPRRT